MSIKITGTFAPQGDGGFPLLSEQDLLGGWRTVDDITARDTIPTLVRTIGMAVYCVADGNIYQLIEGIDNSNWVIYSQIPSLTTAKEDTFLIADSLTPDMRVPTNAVSDGTSIWVLKSNYTLNSSNSSGVVRIDPITNKYIESLDIGTGDPNNLTDALDAGLAILWTGTQLFIFGTCSSTYEMWVREVIIGQVSSFGPRLVISTDIPLVAVWDSVNNKIWVLGEFTGTIYRLDPATLTTPEISLTVGSGFRGYGMAFDPDGSVYPDSKPRLYVSDPFATHKITRYKDLDTSPVSDATSSDDYSSTILIAGGYLYSGQASTLSRYIREPFSNDIQNDGPSSPLGAIFDSISGDGFILATDDSQRPFITKVDTDLNTLDTTTLSTTALGAFAYIPCSMCMLDGYIWVPVEDQATAGRGDVFKLDPTTLDSYITTVNFGLEFTESFSRTQVILAGMDGYWDGYSDVVVLAMNDPQASSVIFGFSRTLGKKITLIDGLGMASGSHTIDAMVYALDEDDGNYYPNANPVGNYSSIKSAYGSMTIISTYEGGWVVIDNSSGNSLSEVLSVGNSTNGNLIIITDGDAIVGTNGINTGDPGGSIIINAGQGGDTNGPGGGVAIYGGQESADLGAEGGYIYVNGSDGNGNGGTIAIAGGDAANGGNGADVSLTGGDGDGAGNGGNIILAIGAGTAPGQIQLTGTLTSSSASTTGGGLTLPALVASYLILNINGTNYKIPLYAN